MNYHQVGWGRRNSFMQFVLDESKEMVCTLASVASYIVSRVKSAKLSGSPTAMSEPGSKILHADFCWTPLQSWSIPIHT